MMLLIVTQILDADDPVLGFFHTWVYAFAVQYKHVIVVCLQEGSHTLPENVSVYSLGKERGVRGKYRYAVRFLAYAWRLRREYTTVFVHMNQEYVLIAGWLWRLLGKRIYLWRNHYAGSRATDVAAWFCSAVFCTSRFSYTARYAKTRIMPVGVDLQRFQPIAHITRVPRSVLFLSRMAPAKRPALLVDALIALSKHSNESFSASLYGSPRKEDEPYYQALCARGEQIGITFHSGVPNHETPAIYSAHEIFVNVSPSGMFDKTLFEAAACGCIVLTSSADFGAHMGEKFLFPPDGDASILAHKIAELLSLSEEEKEQHRQRGMQYAKTHSLDALVVALGEEMRM